MGYDPIVGDGLSSHKPAC